MFFFIFKHKKGAKKLGLGQAVVARHNLIGLKENFHGLIPGNRQPIHLLFCEIQTMQVRYELPGYHVFQPSINNASKKIYNMAS